MKILFKGLKKKQDNIGYCDECHCVFAVTHKKDIRGYGGNDYFLVDCPKCGSYIRFDFGSFRLFP